MYITLNNILTLNAILTLHCIFSHLLLPLELCGEKVAGLYARTLEPMLPPLAENDPDVEDTVGSIADAAVLYTFSVRKMADVTPSTLKRCNRSSPGL